MRKVSLLVVILLILVGCQNVTNGKLDTSILKKIENQENQEQANNIPITYKAHTLKDGLDALPFEVKLPEKLPFEANPFEPPVIDDFHHDGKKIKAEFIAYSKDKNDKSMLLITIFNEEGENENTDFEEVYLKNDVIASYSNNALQYNKDGVLYIITYINTNISIEQHKNDIIFIANQMF